MCKQIINLLLMLYWLHMVCGQPTYTNSMVKSSNSASNNMDETNSLFSTNLDNHRDVDDVTDNSDGNKDKYDKRVERYSFGLGRRAYTYTNSGNGLKRLPVYNFGLGKRSRPYSFGLGKRSDPDDDSLTINDLGLDFDLDGALEMALLMDDEKRNRPYSFGLGKRQPDNYKDRTLGQLYSFGIGR